MVATGVSAATVIGLPVAGDPVDCGEVVAGTGAVGRFVAGVAGRVIDEGELSGIAARVVDTAVGGAAVEWVALWPMADHTPRSAKPVTATPPHTIRRRRRAGI
jgi:hypothetical protein